MLLCAGCGSLQTAHRDAAALPAADVAYAQALAHFAEGIILEAEGGRGSAAALDAFQSAARLDPGTPLLGNMVASRLVAQSRHEEALAELERVCRDAPTAATHGELAQVAEALGRFDLAAEHYAEAARRDPASAHWALSQVRALFKADADRQALRALKRLAQGGNTPDPAPPFAWGVDFIARQREPLRGLACLEIALDCATNAVQEAEVLSAISAGHLQAGNTNAALSAMRDAAGRVPADISAAFRMARLDQLVLGPAATSRWQRAVSRRPDDLPARFALARAAAEGGDKAGSLAHLEAACGAMTRGRLVPFPSTYAFHAQVLEDCGRVEEAIVLLLEAIAAHPASAMLMNHLAYVWAVHNTRLDEAERFVKRALVAEPRNGAYVDTLGWVYYRQGRLEEALAQLTFALRLEPGDAAILDHVGDVMMALGRRDEAIAFWTRSYLAAPETPELAAKLTRHGVDMDELAAKARSAAASARRDAP